MSKISVIVPVYNGEKDIERCLFSLLNQTMAIDIIVVDDGSKDGTANVVNKYVEEFKGRIRYFYKENSGISDTRNYGVSKVETEYFGFLDSDDYVNCDMYEKMYNAIIKDDSDICMSNFLWVYENETKEAKDIGYKDKHEILSSMFATLWNKLYKTKWFKDTGITFPSGLRYEDASVLYRLAMHMDKVAYVDEAFVNYVQREGSITHTFNININDMIEVFKGIKDYYINNNHYDEYKDEIEYLFIRFFLGNSYLRACRIKDKVVREETLNKGWNFLIENYPDFKKNRYLNNSGLKNKYFKLMNRQMYFSNVYIFKLLYALGIMK